MEDNLLSVVVILLVVAVVVFSVRDTNFRREKGKLELQRSALIEKLRGLGVHAFLSERSFTGIDFRITNEARRLEEEHFYGSAWNLESQIDYEQSQRDLLALKKDQEALSIKGDPATDFEKALLDVKLIAEEINREAENSLPGFEKALAELRAAAEEVNRKAKSILADATKEEGYTRQVIADYFRAEREDQDRELVDFDDEEWESPQDIIEDNLDRQVRLEEARLQQERLSRPHEGGEAFRPPDPV